MKTFYATFLLIFSAIVLSACLPNSQEPTPAPVIPATPAEINLTEDDFGEPVPDEIEEANTVVIDTADYKFSPNTIMARAGQTIRVNLIASEGMHDFVIDELGVQSALIEAGEETFFEIVIPADAAGSEYEFYCSVSNHRAMGMVGTLVVTE